MQVLDVPKVDRRARLAQLIRLYEQGQVSDLIDVYKRQVLGQRTFLPETGATLRYTVFVNETNADEFGLWLTGGEEAFFATPGSVFTSEEIGAADFDADGVPATIPGWRALTRAETCLLYTSESRGERVRAGFH